VCLYTTLTHSHNTGGGCHGAKGVVVVATTKQQQLNMDMAWLLAAMVFFSPLLCFAFASRVHICQKTPSLLYDCVVGALFLREVSVLTRRRRQVEPTATRLHARPPPLLTQEYQHKQRACEARASDCLRDVTLPVASRGSSVVCAAAVGSGGASGGGRNGGESAARVHDEKQHARETEKENIATRNPVTSPCVSVMGATRGSIHATGSSTDTRVTAITTHTHAASIPEQPAPQSHAHAHTRTHAPALSSRALEQPLHAVALCVQASARGSEGARENMAERDPIYIDDDAPPHEAATKRSSAGVSREAGGGAAGGVAARSAAGGSGGVGKGVGGAFSGSTKKRAFEHHDKSDCKVRGGEGGEGGGGDSDDDFKTEKPRRRSKGHGGHSDVVPASSTKRAKIVKGSSSGPRKQ